MFIFSQYLSFLNIYLFSMFIFSQYLSFLNIYLFSMFIFSQYLSFLNVYLFSMFIFSQCLSFLDVYLFSMFFFNRFCPVEKCGASNLVNDFTPISKNIECISLLIFSKGSAYKVSFSAIMAHIKVVPNYSKLKILDLSIVILNRELW